METAYMTNAFEIQDVLTGTSPILPSKFTLVKFEDFLLSKGINPDEEISEDVLSKSVIEFIINIQKRNKKTRDCVVPVFKPLDNDINQLALEYSLIDFDINKNYTKKGYPIPLKEIIDIYTKKVLISDFPTLTAMSYDFGVLFRE